MGDYVKMYKLKKLQRGYRISELESHLISFTQAQDSILYNYFKVGGINILYLPFKKPSFADIQFTSKVRNL